MLYKSAVTAIVVAAAVLSFTVGVLSKKVSLEMCRPGAEATRTLNFDGAARLHLKNSDGAVKVSVGTSKSIQLSATIRAYAPDWATQPVAQQYITGLVAAKQEGDALEVVTEPGQRPDEIDLRVDYEIEVPQGADITIEGSNGNVWVANGCDDVDVQGNNSDIEINGPTGKVYAKTANGRIRILNANKETEIETVNGSVYATVTGGGLKATTANGNIVTTVADKSVDACDLTAMNGGITLLMAAECSADVAATTGRGTVRSDLPLTAPTGSPKRRELHGRIGAGDTRITMNSLNGNISISRSDS